MPHNNSAAKRLRKNEKRRVANKGRISEIKSIRQRIERSLHDGQLDQAKTLYREFAQQVDQAASVSTLHRKTASRLKSRVALALNKPAPAASAAKSATAAKPKA